MKKPGRP